jgi:hypothetical protein
METKKCKSCGEKFSFNPMRSQLSSAVRCPHCHTMQTITEMAAVKDYFPTSTNPVRTAQTPAAKTESSGNAALLWTVFGPLFLLLAITIMLLVVITGYPFSHNVVAESSDSEKNTKDNSTSAMSAAELNQTGSDAVPLAIGTVNAVDANKTADSKGNDSLSTKSPVIPFQPQPTFQPSAPSKSAPNQSNKSAINEQQTEPRPTPLNDELESLKAKIESGKISSAEMMHLARTPVIEKYRDQIAGALQALVAPKKTMDDPTTLAVIRWSNLDTGRWLNGKIESGKSIDVAFFYALVCVGDEQTRKRLASLDMVAESDYPLIQQGQPEWVLMMDRYDARPECLKLEKFFTDYLLESHQYPVRKMGLIGCNLCGRGYCLSRLADISEDDPAPDVKDLARKTWETVSARKSSGN